MAVIFSSKVILLSIKKIPEIQKITKKENFRSSILDKDGNILAKSVPVVNIGINPNLVVNKEKLNDPSFRTAAEAAMRAVNNPDCSPLLLPADKYEQWKEINFTFDFSWMFD